MMSPLQMTKLDIVLLCTNLFVLGALTVLIILRGADVPKVVLAVGALGMAVGKLGRVFAVEKNQAT